MGTYNMIETIKIITFLKISNVLENIFLFFFIEFLVLISLFKQQQNYQQYELAMDTNGVNYYKGVLLCSRPNENPSIPKQKPFCPRVTPPESLGLLPTKKFDQHEVRKRVLPVLNNHKRWLQDFKKKIEEKKETQEEQKKKQLQRLERIKQQGLKRRQVFKKSAIVQNNESDRVDSNDHKLPPIYEAKQNVPFKEQKRLAKKGEKPGWAKSAKERQEEEQQQVDELLDFFDKNDVKDFLDDNEINRMLKDLKQRIELMKNDGGKDGNWRKKRMEKIEQQKNNSDQEKKDDILSRITRNSDAKSMASQKTAQRVQQLEKKKKEKEWDKNTLTQKKSYAASVDEQIAKNVADEVLRNYPALKHHSNQSIRKLLQKQAHQQIKE